MTEIIRTYNSEKVRIKEYNNELYFCVSDIGGILNLSNIHRNIKSFKKGVHTMTTLTNGGLQELVYCNESNLYRLIFKSKKLEAIDFQNWIFDEVIPSIRKTGKYSIPEKLKIESTKTRNELTNTWLECGITKPYEYINLTMQEYKSLDFEKGKKKKDFTEPQIRLLQALEIMEQLKLEICPKNGYYECVDNLKETANQITNILEKEKIKQINRKL